MDLKFLNHYLLPVRCILGVRQAINARDCFANIDLRHTYVYFWQGHWRLLRFVFKGKVFRF